MAGASIAALLAWHRLIFCKNICKYFREFDSSYALALLASPSI